MKKIGTMYEKLFAEIQKAERIAILSHVPPDGDALGSMLALYEALRNIGKQVDAYTHEVPATYTFMPGLDALKKEPQSTAYDLVILVDCADVRMLGPFLPIYESAGMTASIDHHISNSGNGKVNVLDFEASSAAQIVLSVLEAGNLPITVSMATNLYVGISTDTGNFCYSNVNARTFEDVARLMRFGADLTFAANNLYKRRTLLKTRLFGQAIQNLELFAQGRLAVMVIDHPDFEALGSSELDYEGVIDFARDVDTVEVAVLMRRARENRYKISLRSKNGVDVNAIAQHFGGGGHKQASGCMIRGTQQEVRDALIAEISKVLS